MLQPTRDLILIKADEAPSKLGNFHVVENWKTLPLTGEVLAIGPDVFHVKTGDRVSFMRYATVILEDNERLCNERHVYATIDG